MNDQRNNTVVGIRKSLASRLGKPVNKESNSLPITEKSVCFPLQNHTPTEPMGIGPLLQKNFRGFCYQKIKTGKCQRHTCPYKHDVCTHNGRNLNLFFHIQGASAIVVKPGKG